VTDEAPEINLDDESIGEGGASPHILAALHDAPLFDEMFMRMQATNVSIVDGLIEPMETELLHELIETEHTPLPSAMAVSAMSQMWMFAVYELFRTWRRRVQALIKIHKRVMSLPPEELAAALESEANKVQSTHEDANLALSMQRSSIMRLADAHFVTRLQHAYDEIEPIFRRIEALRVTLAKHEIPKTKGLVAFAPGYGRIDYLTGSIYWQIDLKDNAVDVINRRSIANDLRRLQFEPARSSPNDR
jgi:hypothetical protein